MTTPSNTTVELAIAGSQSKFALTESGLQIKSELTLDEYRSLLSMFKVFADRYNLNFAGAIHYGEIHFGTAAVQDMLVQLEFPHVKVSRAMSIAGLLGDQLELKFETFTGLTDEHYAILGREFKDHDGLVSKWAGLAQEHQLTPRALVRSIEKGAVVTDAELKGTKDSTLAYFDEMELAFRMWLHRVGGEERVLGLEQEHLRDLYSHFKAIEAFISKLKEACDE